MVFGKERVDFVSELTFIAIAIVIFTSTTQPETDQTTLLQLRSRQSMKPSISLEIVLRILHSCDSMYVQVEKCALPAGEARTTTAGSNPSYVQRQGIALPGKEVRERKVAVTVPEVDGAIRSGVMSEDVVPMFARLEDTSKVPPTKPVLAGRKEDFSEDFSRYVADLGVPVSLRPHVSPESS